MRLRSEQPICQTSKTPVCLTYLVSSTSSCQWWSPRATPTRNPSTTTVSEHVQMPKEDDFSLGGRYIWTNLELFMKVILSSTLVKLITDAGQLSHKCFFLSFSQWFSLSCCSSSLVWQPGWCCILGLSLAGYFNCTTSLTWILNCCSLVWLLSTSSFVLSWRWVICTEFPRFPVC